VLVFLKSKGVGDPTEDNRRPVVADRRPWQSFGRKLADVKTAGGQYYQIL
jgi:5-methylcytosine-specific restriction endonuclease McrA